MTRRIPNVPLRSPRLNIIGGFCLTAMLGLILLAVPQAAAAATFTVNSTVDSADLLPGDGVCADSLLRCTLRAAVMEANASVGPNTIMVPAGTYTLTIGPFDDEENFDGAHDEHGDLDILNNNLTMIGAGSALTIIDGGAIDRVFDVNNFSAFGTAVNVTFQGLTIRNGNAPTTGSGYQTPGGGIMFDGTDNNTGLPVGTLTITNCRITSNTASNVGGGVVAIFGSLIVTGSEISSNTSVNASGGGVFYDGGGSSGLRNLQVTNSTITGNHAANPSFGNGAGIYEGGNATKIVRYNVITNNNAGNQGGGVLNSSGPLTMDFNVIVGNSAGVDPSSSGFRNSGGTIVVENDWWGCNQGPGFSPCDRASGPAGFGILQWLTLNHAATPNAIPVNTSTTLQADFYLNNAGSAILPTDLVALNGRAVVFNNAVLGTISGADPTIQNGKANATFTAGAVGGNGNADATVDHATVTASITVLQQPLVGTNPSDQTVCEGGTATFTASAVGFPPPTVQWQVSTGGPFTDIPGATSTTYSFTATAAQNGNQYRAVFTNSAGTSTTTAATLTVNTAPVVTANPSSQTVCEGGTASFTAAASGSSTVQWQVSTGGPFTDIPGATSTTYSFTATAAQNGNQYRAVFTNTCGSTNTTAATLTISPNTSTTAPANQTVCQGDDASFSTTASGTGPFHYAWTVDGSPVGGDSSSVTVSTGSLSAGNHTVTVVTTGACGSDTESATLTVQASTATTDPADQTVCQGTTANFSTTASGTGPFTYAWTVDGSPAGGNSSSLSVPTGSLSLGNHTVAVTVTGACGSASQSATLTVNANTTTTDPPNQTVCQGATANFSTTASGTGPFTYAWTVDGTPAGGNSSTLSVPTGSLSVGNHTVAVTVTGACGSASQSATLTVNANTATTDPPDQTVCKGATANFSTTASGTGPFSYAWTLDGSPFGGNTSSISVPTGSLSVGNHTVAVTVTGTCGSASQSATLTVNANTATTDPPDRTVCLGSTTSFTTTASGTAPFSFVWKQGVTVLTTGSFGGRVTVTNTATTSTLTITNVQAGDAGAYTVETTGACSMASQSSTLTVNSTPPGIVLNGNNIQLWPPNHSYHTINVTNLVASASSCDGTVNLNSVVIDKVTSDEVENGNGDGNTNNDIVIACNRKSVQLRSERDGSGDGRVYTITFKVTDSFGVSSTVTAKVTVPKSQNGNPAVDSGVHYTVTNATCP